MSVSRETYCYADWPEHKILYVGAQKLGIDLSEEQVLKLLQYLNLLRIWNRKISLVSTEKPSEQVILHLLDSMSPLVFFDDLQKKVMDFGSGAGLPGLVLKILSPQWEMTLVDSKEKKAVFLRQAVRKLELKGTTVLNTRLGSGPTEGTGTGYDLITFRAVGDCLEIAKILKTFLVPGGGLLAYLGPNQILDGLDPDFEDLGYHVGWIRDLNLPFLERRRRLVYLAYDR